MEVEALYGLETMKRSQNPSAQEIGTYGRKKRRNKGGRRVGEKAEQNVRRLNFGLVGKEQGNQVFNFKPAEEGCVFAIQTPKCGKHYL